MPADYIPGQRRLTLGQKILGSKVLLVSVILHVIFGAGAAVYVVSTWETKRKLTFTGGPPTTNPSKRALEHKAALGKKKNMMSAPAQAKRITTTNSMAKIALPEMPTIAGATDVIPNKMSGLGGVGNLAGVGGGGGGMGGGGGGSGINFFGLRARTRDVVFVVDVSQSMVVGLKNAGSYSGLESEVEKVIKALDPTSRFGLVVFSRDADTYRDSLSSARPDEKNRAIAFLKKNTPVESLGADVKPEIRDKHMGTRADKGLERAFKMRPDTIFFVSDGAPTTMKRADVLEFVQQLQKTLPRPAVVNVVAYKADDGQQFMEDLAKQNGGTFREVN